MPRSQLAEIMHTGDALSLVCLGLACFFFFPKCEVSCQQF